MNTNISNFILPTNRLLNKKQSAKYLGVSVPTLYKLIKQGDIPPPIRISAKREGFNTRDLDKFIDG